VYYLFIFIYFISFWKICLPSDDDHSFHIKPEEPPEEGEVESSSLFLHTFSSGPSAASTVAEDTAAGFSSSSGIAEAVLLACNRLETELEKVGIASGSIL
jgi:hypothetical protein